MFGRERKEEIGVGIKFPDKEIPRVIPLLAIDGADLFSFGVVCLGSHRHSVQRSAIRLIVSPFLHDGMLESERIDIVCFQSHNPYQSQTKGAWS